MRVTITTTIDGELKERAMRMLREKNIRVSQIVDNAFQDFVNKNSMEVQTQ
jgi:antitoxin component of RelBE/YafQ-DinJ toxin-antitoxin module